MNIKIKYHIMPWEIDFALLTFDKLKRSSYYLNPDDKIYIDIGLNLSSYFIDWEESKLNREFFTTKLWEYVKLLDWAEVKVNIYSGEELWGHLDLEREQIQENIDYYISICPDFYFHEHLLYYLIEAAKQVKDKYFLITPETFKLWDHTWDELVNERYRDWPYEAWKEKDAYQIQHDMITMEEPSLRKTRAYKWAGWFDLYSKSVVEELIPIPDGWKGYGPWDYYGMIIAERAASKGTELGQYVLKNQVINEYQPEKCDFRAIYKDLLVLKQVPDQRQERQSEFDYYINKWVEYAKDKKII